MEMGLLSQPEIGVAESGPQTEEAVADVKPTVALHVCCGPCASAVIERLQAQWTVHAIWYDPNIQPSAEHQARLEGMRRVAELMDVPLVDLGYDVEEWCDACAGLMDEPEGGRRCDVCFRLRLERTAVWAAGESIGAITTTLTVSPHKPAERIFAIGTEVAERHDLVFLEEDFKKENGFQRSVELSKRWGLYRQNYCGCLPSRRDT